MFSAATKSARVAAAANYIEDVFSTYLYTGNGSTQTITNGIDLSTYGGLVWVKSRSAVKNNCLVDTVRGVSKALASNTTGAQDNSPGYYVNAFNADGFGVGAVGDVGGSGVTFGTWTFRKQPKFFDVVTYTGDGNSSQTISHNLGSVPGCMFVKCSSSTGSWFVYHGSLGNTGDIFLNTTAAARTGVVTWNSSTPTSTQFQITSAAGLNTNGVTYVAYLFAHNAGGFGLTGTDNVISCGSFSLTSGGQTTVNLGYEPQWILFKQSGGVSDWAIYDTMRGMSYSDSEYLRPNSSAAETSSGPNIVFPTATGFTVNGADYFYSGVTSNWIYIAIRRGPMKTPTSGTSVFDPETATASTGTSRTIGFPADMSFGKARTITASNLINDRLRGYANSNTTAPSLFTNNTNAESTATSANVYNVWNTTALDGAYFDTYSTIWYHFRRAPGFFDEVCYTGDNVSGRTVQHNLGTAPDLVFVKCRSTAGPDWYAYGRTGNTNQLAGSLNNTWAFSSFAGFSGFTQQPTSQYLYLSSGADETNGSGKTYVAYLFGSVTGVSKVGTYTGNGSTQTINCGFTSGARFVLIKRTDASGDWYVYDTARGMTTLTDPYLLMNSTAAEVATLGSVTTVSTGFALNASILAAINTNGASYIFLAIA